MIGTIYENVPLPSIERGFAPRQSQYPFAQMEVGQCLRIEPQEIPKGKVANIRAAIAAYRKKHAPDSKWAVRVYPDNTGSIGVWRLV